ncbi:DUF998 domain-containing protein [Micromonospora costi]|uniref:DUF998 domain-containing protein n=1 Tax=Micromonospora costi TaxID=1530042 RepID=A0A3B0ACF7_9ACTN|nr:DUF998 domain-containing protein [Micromonospora costi]
MPTARAPVGPAPATGTAGRPRAARGPAVVRVAGLVVAGVAMLLFGVLHLPGSPVHPVRDTVSDYALSRTGWLFDVAVLALAAGSALLLAPEVLRSGRPAALRHRFVAAGLGAWCVGLVVLVVFPRDPVGAPVTTTGDIHRWAAVAALSGLPLGALLAAVRHPGRLARAVVLGAVACAVAMVPFVAAYLVGSPLRPFVGLIERLVCLGEVGLLVLVAHLRPRGVATYIGSTPGGSSPPAVASRTYSSRMRRSSRPAWVGTTSRRRATAMVRVTPGGASRVIRTPGRRATTMPGTSATPRPASTKLSTASISPPSTANVGSKPAARHA